jgi:hypothetical protein
MLELFPGVRLAQLDDVQERLLCSENSHLLGVVDPISEDSHGAVTLSWPFAQRAMQRLFWVQLKCNA